MKTIIGLFLFIVILFPSCNIPQVESGIILENMDQSVRPQDDFFRYVNGTWLKETEIPNDMPVMGSFTTLYQEAEKHIQAIIEKTALNTSDSDSDQKKLALCYQSFMDSVLCDKLRITPLEKDMEMIDKVETRDDLIRLFAYMERCGFQYPLTFYISQDDKNAQEYITYLNQSGLSLPDKSYYLREDEKAVGIRKSFTVFIEEMLDRAYIESARSKAGLILYMETELAKIQWSRIQNRDTEKTYSKLSLSDLDTLCPDFNFRLYLKEIGIDGIDAVVVRQLTYFDEFNRIFNSFSVEEWKDFCRYKVYNSAARMLSSDFVKLSFNFYGKTLSGTEEMRPRWKRAVNFTNGFLGEIIGQLYIEEHFQPESKERMLELVNNLKISFEERINQLDWMSEETKEQALIKLGKFNAKIGYPDKWQDYSGLKIKEDDLVENYRAINQFVNAREVKKLNGPIDRSEWLMTPQTVNAYYYGSMNEIVFPAAILQPPFFNPDADDAVNYGAIGAIIGHEMTHGFDDQGRKTDGDGNIREWWTSSDNEKFIEKTKPFIEQYSNYFPIDSIPINGELTLGENIGDLGGLVIAYNAYMRSLNGQEAPVIDGFTGPQRFFIGYGQVHAQLNTDDYMRQKLVIDPHSPGRFRCNGVLVNMPEFYEAFGVKPGDKMHRSKEQIAEMW